MEGGGIARVRGNGEGGKVFQVLFFSWLFSGCVESAEFPFTALASSADVSLEEMRQLVCCKRLRPTIAPHWSRDEVCTKTRARGEALWCDYITMACGYE